MKIIQIIKSWLYFPANLFTVMTQIYGEINRIRLILGEKSIRAKEIEKFDKKYNKYNPYFGSDRSEKKYTALKTNIK